MSVIGFPDLFIFHFLNPSTASIAIDHNLLYAMNTASTS